LRSRPRRLPAELGGYRLQSASRLPRRPEGEKKKNRCFFPYSQEEKKEHNQTSRFEKLLALAYLNSTSRKREREKGRQCRRNCGNARSLQLKRAMNVICVLYQKKGKKGKKRKPARVPKVHLRKEGKKKGPAGQKSPHARRAGRSPIWKD